MSAPICPKCGLAAIRTKTRYGDRFSHCGLHAGGQHPLVSAETHAARNAAHAVFDPLWKRGLVSRATAYKALADALGIDRKDCHMKLMTAEMARRVPAIAVQLEAEFRSARTVECAS